MATGANASYWEDHRLPGVLKLNLLRRYLPVFLIRTGTKTKHVAYVDGFAGKGTYGDGSLGSPGIMLEFAAGQKFGRDTDVDLYLCEKDAASFADLSQLAAPYQKKGLSIDLTNGQAAEHLSAVLPRVAGLPTFIFEDPTGVGVPYTDLVAAMNRNGSAAWPPTEMMINLSLGLFDGSAVTSRPRRRMRRRCSGSTRLSAGNGGAMSWRRGSRRWPFREWSPTSPNGSAPTPDPTWWSYPCCGRRGISRSTTCPSAPATTGGCGTSDTALRRPPRTGGKAPMRSL